MKNLKIDDTICALATGGGKSAIAVIRISGPNSLKITNTIFSKDLSKYNTHSIVYGNILFKNEIIDEVLISKFNNNKSYTGEQTIEISCHGSIYIQKKILELLIDSGCRLANPGEFTLRAFKNGKLDLSQAESVAELIAAESEAEQKTAINHLKGGFSKELNILRQKLIDFASLIELELDFSEEDVEFADRKEFKKLLFDIKDKITQLVNSFKLGNVIKEGIPVSIIGEPNAGKSTLLNTLLNEEKAIVSEIPGTTRDAIEDKLTINGYNFKFIDTAGIRNTNDKIEKLGIKKTLEKASKSEIILFISEVNKKIVIPKSLKKDKRLLIVINKIDLQKPTSYANIKDPILISAKKAKGIDELKKRLINCVDTKKLSNQNTIITNSRHYNELKLCLKEVKEIINALEINISSDLISVNIKQALFHLGSITGEITTDTLLGNIFSKFCIGK